jgi:ribonuclease VapC
MSERGCSIEASGFVLDSFALLAYFHDERGAEEVQRHLGMASVSQEILLMSFVNLAEVLYLSSRRRGPATAARIHGSIELLPITMVTAALPETSEAARLKARYPISLAAAYCAALARIHDYPVLTGDSEFEALEGEIRVHWL